MEISGAVQSLSALAQPARLRVFRHLVKQGNAIPAGELAETLGLPKPTLSFHLKELVNAGLIQSERHGRSIHYELKPNGIRELIGFLTEDCCQGRPELCMPGGCEIAAEEVMV